MRASGILAAVQGWSFGVQPGLLSHLAKSVWQTDRVIAGNGPQCGPLSLRGSPVSDTIHVAPSSPSGEYRIKQEYHAPHHEKLFSKQRRGLLT